MSDASPKVTVKAQPPAAAKFDPVKVSELPTLAGLGVIVIFGMIVRVVWAESPMFPNTCMPFGGASIPEDLPEVFITNEPVTDPPATEHEGLPSIVLAGPLIVQLVSLELKPEPVMCIVSPPLPVLGESDIEGPVTEKVSDTQPAIATTCESVNLTEYDNPTAAVLAILTSPVRSPFESTLQLPPPVQSKRTGDEGNVVIPPLQSVIGPLYPEPDKATLVPIPPVFGVNKKDDRTMNCTSE